MREEVYKEIKELSQQVNHLLIELPTGYGKTKGALEIVESKYNDTGTMEVLVVVPRNVLKNEWKKEIDKWMDSSFHINWTFVTYVSFPKIKGRYDITIFDEAHHITERCMDALTRRDYDTYFHLYLSATVKEALKLKLNRKYPDFTVYSKTVKEAIEEEILPDPRVFLIPLTLSNTEPTESIWKNPKGKKPVIETSWSRRWEFIKQKKQAVRIYCTEAQYYQDLSGKITWLKKKYMSSRTKMLERRWLKLCKDRLDWLSDKKTDKIKTILSILKDQRTLCFCNSIEQTELLGKYCINSKNKESQDNLDRFNLGKIKHITACNMLNEGMNLNKCRIGIYANLNSSEIIVKQRLGRILRHDDPVIIIPYYKGTREEEIVNVMMEDYNPEKIKQIKTMSELKL